MLAVFDPNTPTGLGACITLVAWGLSVWNMYHVTCKQKELHKLRLQLEKQREQQLAEEESLKYKQERLAVKYKIW